ncbi:N-acetyltransferase family protein [Escherichia coli]
MLVSEEDGVVTGYASIGDWRSFDGFRHTVEHSVYVIWIIRAKVWGVELLSRLIDEARDRGKHVMVAGIESQNQASLHLHQSWHLSSPHKCRRWALNLGAGWIDIYAVATRRTH